MGPHVVRYLLQSGHDVAVFHRGKSGTCDDGARHIHGDRRELAGFRSKFEEFAPQVVVHMIAMDERDADTTIASLRGIAEHIVLISSMDVYRAYGRFIGKDEVAIDNTAVTEDAPLRAKRFPYRSEETPPDSMLYNYDKIVVEDAFLRCPDFQTTVLRLPAVYGPADKQHRTYDYVKRMVDGRPAIVLDQDMSQWRWSRGFVDDVAWGIFLTATKQPRSRVYNIAAVDAQSEHEWLLEIARAMNWNGEIVCKPSGKKEYEWSQHLVSDTARIRAELGYRERTDADEALRRTVAWESEQIKSGAYDRPVNYAEEDKLLREANPN
jgi:nucleoside-diphosphate-sugar epimerase